MATSSLPITSQFGTSPLIGTFSFCLLCTCLSYIYERVCMTTTNLLYIGCGEACILVLPSKGTAPLTIHEVLSTLFFFLQLKLFSVTQAFRELCTTICNVAIDRPHGKWLNSKPILITIKLFSIVTKVH